MKSKYLFFAPGKFLLPTTSCLFGQISVIHFVTLHSVL